MHADGKSTLASVSKWNSGKVNCNIKSRARPLWKQTLADKGIHTIHDLVNQDESKEMDPLKVRKPKNAIRIITFNDRYTYTNPLFSQLKILKEPDIHSFQLLSFLYQCQHDHPVSHFEPSQLTILKDVHDRKILHTQFFQSSVYYYSSYT